MAATPSTMMPLGTIAPDFSLLDTTSGQVEKLQDLKGKIGTLIMFICNHCPYVKHMDEELVRLANEFQAKGISFIAISSNDIVNYPDDSPELMKKTAKEVGYPFPYLYDETQEIAKAYDAACTPDFFLFDSNLACFYRGQLDGSRPKNDIPVSGKDMRHAMNALIDGSSSPEEQIPSIGCNIKWKA